MWILSTLLSPTEHYREHIDLYTVHHGTLGAPTSP